MRRIVLLTLCVFLYCTGAHSQLRGMFARNNEQPVKGTDYTIDDNGYIVVSEIMEGVNADKETIYNAAYEYIKNAYQETRYEIVQEDEDNGTVTGKGTYLNFCAMNMLLNTYYLCADFYLRVDAKENRARIALYVLNYSGQRIFEGTTEVLEDKIIDFPPVNESSTEKKKLYTRAFPILIGRMEATLSEVKKSIKESEQTGIGGSNDDW